MDIRISSYNEVKCFFQHPFYSDSFSVSSKVFNSIGRINFPNFQFRTFLYLTIFSENRIIRTLDNDVNDYYSPPEFSKNFDDLSDYAILANDPVGK